MLGETIITSFALAFFTKFCGLPSIALNTPSEATNIKAIGAVSPGIIAFTLYTKAQESLGASLTGFTLYVFTIYAAIYGFILFDENLQTFHYIGTALVFVGVYLAKKNYDTKT